MKRAAGELEGRPVRRTRAVARNERTIQKSIEFTKLVKSTPLLQALPLVMSSGFLYQCDCLCAAATCKNWCRMWKDVEDRLPECAKVEIRFAQADDNRDPPNLTTDGGEHPDIRSFDFVRTVLNKVNAVRVGTAKTPRGRKRIHDGLPKFGRDLDFVMVRSWGGNKVKVCVAFGKKQDMNESGMLFGGAAKVWCLMCVEEGDLVLELILVGSRRLPDSNYVGQSVLS